MPKKGHKAAARQAQLSRKKRRGKGRPEIFAAGPVKPADSPHAAEHSDEAELDTKLAREPMAATPARATGRARQLAAAAPNLTHAYLGAELRQIGLITIVIVAILAVLTVVLGD